MPKKKPVKAKPKNKPKTGKVRVLKPEVFAQEGKVERVPTGIKGFDQLIEGGLPKKSTVLLAGPCGAGKSIFGMHFLVEGAKKGEAGLFVSLEETQGANLAAWRRFGWNLAQLIDENKMLITEPELYDFEKLLTHIEDNVAKIGAKRLVIDSASLIGNYFQDTFKLRKAFIDLAKLMERIDCTALVVNELPEGSEALSSYGVEEYVTDGVILLYAVKHNEVFHRAVVVRKMQATNHSLKVHPIKLVAPGGIKVYPDLRVFEKF
jgi:KaiC/GvpD/RAD55 family RecA-like ATPase